MFGCTHWENIVTRIIRAVTRVPKVPSELESRTSSRPTNFIRIRIHLQGDLLLNPLCALGLSGLPFEQ